MTHRRVNFLLVDVQSERLYNELGLAGEPKESGSHPTATVISRSDPISCITASEKNFLVATLSGVINQFLLPNAVRIHQIQILDCVPCRLALNKNSSKLALIDRSAKLYIYDFDASNEETGTEGDWLDVKMQDVWDMRWAADNNDLLAICEKNRLTIVNGTTLEREEALHCNGYICSFEQLSVKTVRLDGLVMDTVDGKGIKIESYLDRFESQSVRELKEIMEHSLTDAVNCALQWPHLPSLWNVIAEHSLANLQLDTANLALVKCKDYKGIQFLKKLNRLTEPALKRAEVCVYLTRFEEAEQIYMEQNRSELAIHLNAVRGNYARVLQLLEGKCNVVPKGLSPLPN